MLCRLKDERILWMRPGVKLWGDGQKKHTKEDRCEMAKETDVRNRHIYLLRDAALCLTSRTMTVRVEGSLGPDPRPGLTI